MRETKTFSSSTTSHPPTAMMRSPSRAAVQFLRALAREGMRVQVFSERLYLQHEADAFPSGPSPPRAQRLPSRATRESRSLACGRSAFRVKAFVFGSNTQVSA
ncbi:MAG: hypothetical protein EB084_15690 [Proteobacteria bacterium]|nr:hypothetical protein [Pseudomonadota bacterium]